MEAGIRLLELSQNMHRLFANQTSQKRRLLDFVLSNCSWKGGRLTPEFRQPFDMLADASRRNNLLEFARPAQESENENWLPGMDSNHDNLKQHRICNLQTLQWSKMPDWTRKTGTRTQLVHGRIIAAAPSLVPG
jgi:hypothetical protein